MPRHELTQEERERGNMFRSGEMAVENGRKGGYGKGINKRMSDVVREMLYKPVTDKRHLDVIAKSGMPVPKKPLYVHFLAANMLIKTSNRGKPDEFMKLMEIIGEEPTHEAVENTAAEDALSASIREMAEAVESDAV